MPRTRMAEFETMLRDEARRIGHAGTPPPTIQP
jgi:hypothetical protein